MVRKALGIGVIGALAALMVVSLATAQPGGGGGAAGGGGGRGAGGGGGGGGGRMGGGRGGFGMVTQDSLGATAEEWKVLEPKVTKVQTLNMQISGRGGMRGMRGADTGAAAPAETEIQKARTALNDLVGANATGTPTADQITKALTAFRAARLKAQAELTTAQADLKKVVTPKQEALLVLAGLLE